MNSVFAVQNNISAAVSYDAPILPAGLEHYELEKGIFTTGALAGQAYKIAILHPLSAATCHKLSEDERERERLLGIENVKKRGVPEIAAGMSFNLDPRHKQKGGLIVGLYTAAERKLLAIGAQALIADPDDGGRGQNWTKCPLEEQIILKMGMTHPTYQGMKLTGMIFPHRMNVVRAFADPEVSRRTDVVTKVAGMPTKDFYKQTMNFVQDGEDYILPGVAEPHNRLATLGRNIADVTQWLRDKHPAVFAHKIDLHSLHANHKNPSPQLV